MSAAQSSIDKALLCMSRIRMATVYGKEAMKKEVSIVQQSAPYAQLSDAQKTAVLAYSQGRLDAFDNVTAPVSSASLLLVIGGKS